MRIIYKIGIQFYFLIVLLVSPFNVKARRWIQGRRRLWKRLKQGIDSEKKLVWFHCSSLGEFEQGRTLIEKFRKENPEIFLLLTFFSPSGFELRKNYQGVDLVSYLPLDTRFNAWRFINIVKPEAVYFIKYEFWYYFLRTLKKKNVPVYLVSARFRKDQVFFKWYGTWYRRFFRFFRCFFVQDQASKEILETNGYSNVIISGDTRFDRVNQLSENAKPYPGIESFCQDKNVMIAGSTWEQDEEILVRFINECKDDMKFILAPHEINSRKLYNLVSSIDGLVVRFTDEDKTFFPRARVMLIDTIGHLSSVYQYGKVAYIGGGFGKGIHNILEAATYGLPVIFGPNYKKFREATELIELGAAFSINDHKGFEKIFNDLFNGKSLFPEASTKARNYVVNKLGATDIVLKHSRITEKSSS